MHVGGLQLTTPPRTRPRTSCRECGAVRIGRAVPPFNQRQVQRFGVVLDRRRGFRYRGPRAALALPRPGRIHELLRWRRNCTATTWIARVPCGRTTSSTALMSR